MGGKLHNESVLTPDYLARAVENGKTITIIAAETGISRRTVFDYMGKVRLRALRATPDEMVLKGLIDKAHDKADELQIIYLKIDKLKDRMLQNNELIDMVKLTRLAEQLKQRKK